MARILIYLLCTVAILGCKENPSTSSQTEVTYTDPVIEGISMKIEQDTTNTTLRYERAKLLYDRELYSESIQDLEYAISKDSLQPDYYHLLADNYLDYYRSRDAIKILNKCLLQFPGRVPTLLKLSEFYFILKQTDQSLSTLNYIIKDHPQNAEAFYMLGMNFKEMKDDTRAINSFQRAVELDASLSDGWIILGELHAQRDDPAALSYYKNGKMANPKSLAARHALAYYLQDHNQEEKAIAEYEELIHLDKNYGSAYLNMGILLLEKDSVQKAHNQFRILTEIEPTNAVAHFYTGITYEYMGDTLKARMSYENAINLDPNYKNAKTQIEKLSL